MPLYAYRCSACGAAEEHIQKFSDPPVTQCEACGGPLAKQISATVFHLKGGGWYKDGYASSSGSAASSDGGESGGSKKSESAPKSGSESTSTSKSDSSSSSSSPSSTKAAAE